MLEFVPVNFAAYRPLKPHLRWTLQNLVAFADRSGKCWPSIRTLSAATGTPRSTVSRHLRQLVADGAIARQRRPGGTYSYQINSRFLPAARAVSHPRKPAVPPARTEENRPKKIERSLPRFAGLDEGLPRAVDWAPRLQSWRQSKFWLPLWGPRPDQPGCFVPVALRG